MRCVKCNCVNVRRIYSGLFTHCCCAVQTKNNNNNARKKQWCPFLSLFCAVFSPPKREWERATDRERWKQKQNSVSWLSLCIAIPFPQCHTASAWLSCSKHVDMTLVLFELALSPLPLPPPPPIPLPSLTVSLPYKHPPFPAPQTQTTSNRKQIEIHRYSKLSVWWTTSRTQ